MNESSSIDAPVDRVLEAFTSEDFARRVSERAGVEFQSLQVDGATDGAFSVTTVRSVGADKIPGVAKKFLGKGMTLTQKDAYSAPEADGSRTVETEIDVAGVPISASASQRLQAAGEKTTVEVRGEVTANIPLVGKKIAAAAEPYIGRAIGLQSSTAEAWLKDHS